MAQPALTILVVDDNDIDRDSYCRYLHRATEFACTILEAARGSVGLTICQQTRPDVILLDYLLPDLNGLEFLTALKGHMGAQMPPLIMITGQGSEAIAAQTIKAGAEDYLIKDQITPPSLQHSVLQAIEKVRLRRQLRSSEERLQLALEAAQMGTWEWRSHSNALFCSDQVGSLFGISGHAFSNSEAFFERVHPDDRVLVQQAVEQAFRSNTQCDIEFRVIWPDDSVRWLNGKGQFYPSPNHQSERMLGTIADITRARQAELERYQTLQSDKFAAQIAQFAGEASSLDKVLQAAVTQVRRALQTDRVVIFYLPMPDTGVVITESVAPGWTSIVDSPFHDPCLASSYIKRHKKDQTRTIADIYNAQLAPCYITFLESLQVKASLVVPIAREERVWGLLIAHHCTVPRSWQPSEVKLLKRLAIQIGLVFQQTELERRVDQASHERRQASAKLREREARFQQAIAEAPFPIFIHSEDGKILQMSQAVSELTGYAASEIPTLSEWTKRAYGEEYQDAVLEGINDLYSLNQQLDEGEFEVRTRSGATRTWLFSSASLGRLRNGIRSVVSIAADVTAQKQAEVALKTRLQQQAAVAKLSQTALLGSNLETLFAQIAQTTADSLDVKYCKILGLLDQDHSLLLRAGIGWPSHLIGQTILSADVNSQAGYTLLTQQPVIFEDLRTETRFQGSPLLTDYGIVSGMSVVIPSSGDRPFGVLAINSTRKRHFIQDDVNFLQAVANLLATVISRKQVEQELHQLNFTLEQRVQERTQALEAANQDLQSFAYSVAHDLRAPLRAIQGFAQVLAEDYGNTLDALGNEYIHRMATAAEHLDVLIQDLLMYSHLGQVEIKLQQVSVAAVMKDILTSLEPTLVGTQANIETGPNLPTVRAQNTILKQILSNLIGNAVKFVAPNVVPQVRIWAALSDRSSDTSPAGPQTGSQWVRIWVADNGIGIAPQHQKRIFTPFERLHGVEEYPGTGIGLAIVQRGVQRLGGRFGVVSAVDQGSQFWLELKTYP
ncbi:MAG: GAF domain-containing protein [Cyanobacteria bacterium J06626_18]